MVDVRAYRDRFGRCPYERWLRSLDPVTQARIFQAVERLEEGNISSLKSVGAGVHEMKLQFGPGYRVYCGQDGDTLVILLGGGTKQRQDLDIERAKKSWQDYKKIKSEELSGR